ncbi:glycerol-3-phosphate 1-O-acyltransferase PlsY [Candidatus Saganbacteria bacterium]|nr:glycerol-3-phosphate 1-O-acyltransferase PlsY [Candidatus Saganbacteria bacterium]
MLIFIILGYLSGSIPFGYLIAKAKGIDIRKTGSGNIGATNIFRTLGPAVGILVFVLDFIKGLAPTLAALFYLNDPLQVILVGLAAILGHSFSIFLKGKGGKGAATGLGVLAVIAPDILAFTAILVVILIFTTRYVSAGSIFGAVTVATLMFILGKPLPYAMVSLLAAALIVVRHIPNIKRLMAGTERKI